MWWLYWSLFLNEILCFLSFIFERLGVVFGVCFLWFFLLWIYGNLFGWLYLGVVGLWGCVVGCVDSGLLRFIRIGLSLDIVDIVWYDMFLMSVRGNVILCKFLFLKRFFGVKWWIIDIDWCGCCSFVWVIVMVGIDVILRFINL